MIGRVMMLIVVVVVVVTNADGTSVVHFWFQIINTITCTRIPRRWRNNGRTRPSFRYCPPRHYAITVIIYFGYLYQSISITSNCSSTGSYNWRNSTQWFVFGLVKYWNLLLWQSTVVNDSQATMMWRVARTVLEMDTFRTLLVLVWLARQKHCKFWWSYVI